MNEEDVNKYGAMVIWLIFLSEYLHDKLMLGQRNSSVKHVYKCWRRNLRRNEQKNSYGITRSFIAAPLRSSDGMEFNCEDGQN